MKRQISFLLIIISYSCVDPIFYEIALPKDLPIAVYGRITNLPGPYQVTINRSFDTQSVKDLKSPISAKKVNLIDELGNDEELKEVAAGVYETRAAHGRIGGVYKIRIELFDGKIYESFPDTLLAPGHIDSIYHEFNSVQDYTRLTTSYGFDLKVNSHGSANYYQWNMIGTFKSLTKPELIRPYSSECFPLLEEQILCNFLPPCSGLRNLAPVNSPPYFGRISPCECCTCWYRIFNNTPILSDALFVANGDYKKVLIYKIPLNEWIFMFKIRTEVTQSTLTENSFRFFKSIRAQKDAIGSLFQPITGKIPNNFVQIKGANTPVNGIFYATGVHTKSIYISPDDVPYPIPVPQVDFTKVGAISCLELFPFSTNIKPGFWED